MQAFDALDRYGREIQGERVRWAEQARLVRLARQSAGVRPGLRRSLALLLRALAVRLDRCVAEPCPPNGAVGLSRSGG